MTFKILTMKTLNLLLSLSIFTLVVSCTEKNGSQDNMPAASQTETMPDDPTTASTEETEDLPEFKIVVQSVDGKTTWVAEKDLVLKPGDKFRFTAEHNLESGPGFHGLDVKLLKISRQVNRGMPFSAVVEIPADAQDGEYPVECQFHAAHVGTKLKIKK